MKTVQEKIREGFYTNTDPYPAQGTPETEELVRAWQDKRGRLEGRFVREMTIELGGSEAAAEDLAFKKAAWMAWEAGHSAGFAEVYNYAIDFFELVKVARRS